MPQITENVLPEAIPELNALLARVSLPSYKLHKGLSQETVAYSSKVALDGAVIGYAKNDGQGGCDLVSVDVAHRDAWAQIVRDFSILTGTEDVEPEALLISVVAEMLAERRMAQTLFRRHAHPVAVAIETPTHLVVIGSWQTDEKGIHADVARQGYDPNLPRRVYRREGR
jgi:hypothetical protein